MGCFVLVPEKQLLLVQWRHSTATRKTITTSTVDTLPLLAPPRSSKHLPLLNDVLLLFTDMRAMPRAGPNAIHKIRRQYAGEESPQSYRGSNEPSYHKTPPPRSLSLTDEATMHHFTLCRIPFSLTIFMKANTRICHCSSLPTKGR